MTAQPPTTTHPPGDDIGPVDEDRVRRVELLISRLLRTGVLLSLLVVVAGMVVTFARNPDYFSSHAQLHPLISTGAQFPHTPTSVMRGLRHGSGPAAVMVGLLLLIATPVMRVAVSIFAFVYQHDRTFVVITSVVLAILLLSFALGHGGA